LETGANNERTVNELQNPWARTLPEVNFIPMSKALFKALVKSLRAADLDTSPIEKKTTIVSILMAISYIRLRSYVMYLTSAG